MSVDESEPILHSSHQNDLTRVNTASMSTTTSNYAAINQMTHNAIGLAQNHLTAATAASTITTPTFTKSTQTTAIEMTSVGTQTDE